MARRPTVEVRVTLEDALARLVSGTRAEVVGRLVDAIRELEDDAIEAVGFLVLVLERLGEATTLAPAWSSLTDGERLRECERSLEELGIDPERFRRLVEGYRPFLEEDRGALHGERSPDWRTPLGGRPVEAPATTIDPRGRLRMIEDVLAGVARRMPAGGDAAAEITGDELLRILELAAPTELARPETPQKSPTEETRRDSAKPPGSQDLTEDAPKKSNVFGVSADRCACCGHGAEQHVEARDGGCRYSSPEGVCSCSGFASPAPVGAAP